MDVELSQPAFLCDLKERCGFRRTGVVDKNIDLAESIDRACGQSLRLVIVADIGSRSPGTAAQFADFLGGRLSPLGVDIGDCDVGSAPRQSQCDRFSNAAPCPGYKRRLPVEFRHYLPRLINRQCASTNTNARSETEFLRRQTSRLWCIAASI